MFNFFGFSPLKLKSAGKSTGNQRIFLQIFLPILALGTKIKMFCICWDYFATKEDTGTKNKKL
jgi:hypothetical protein